MQRLAAWGARAAEAAVAAMLAALFATFLLQIFSRYVLERPFGWTLELCLALWVWIVFFGCAFVVRDRDHVTFDILYLSVPPGPRRVFAAASALAVGVALLASLLPTWDWIDFLKRKRSASLGVPMRTIYAVYAVFLVAVAARAFRRVARIVRGRPADEAHEVHVGGEG